MSAFTLPLVDRPDFHPRFQRGTASGFVYAIGTGADAPRHFSSVSGDLDATDVHLRIYGPNAAELARRLYLLAAELVALVGYVPVELAPSPQVSDQRDPQTRSPLGVVSLRLELFARPGELLATRDRALETLRQAVSHACRSVGGSKTWSHAGATS